MAYATFQILCQSEQTEFKSPFGVQGRKKGGGDETGLLDDYVDTLSHLEENGDDTRRADADEKEATEPRHQEGGSRWTRLLRVI
jgi:hypothetical protein